MSKYTFNTHLHNYAVWTAARAAQRSFTTTENIAAAINATGLRAFAEHPAAATVEDFNQFHRKTAAQLIAHFATAGIECAYGRAAKIIAIYLKTTVIVPLRGEGEICDLIHPPIDRILLQHIAADGKDPRFKTINWTTLDEDGYFNLITRLRGHHEAYTPFWTIEVNWRVA